MLQFRAIRTIAAIMLVGATFTACKKDAFSEKDAIAAQTSLIQMKYDQEIKLEQLKQSGATALAQLQYSFTLQINASQERLKDSLSKLYTRYVDSLTRTNTKYNDSVNRSDSRRRDIIIAVRDQVTLQPIAGATVTIPTLVNTVLQVTTDANGIATFPAAGNINVANPASAIVTKTGYGSGSIFYNIFGSGTAAGTATISLWNQTNNRNTIKGTVTIQTNFVNPTAEFATGKLVNVYSTVTVNGQSQRFDWSALTNATGNYSISVPDLPTGGVFNFSHSAFDTTARLAINSFYPGIDTIPSIQNVPATYYLGVPGGTGGLALNPAGSPLSVPLNVPRYHAVTPVDSNGRVYYFKNLSFNTTLSNITNVINGFIAPNNFQPSNANTYDASGAVTSTFISPKFAGTNNNAFDSLPARFVDVFANADGLFTRNLIMNFYVAAGPNKGVTTQTGNINNLAGSATGSFVLMTKRTANQQANNNYDPLGWATINPSVVNNLNLAVVNKGIATTSSITAAGYSASSSALITTTSVTGGQTSVVNLTYGTGQLKQAVR
ncbi:MAG: hypothetical protein V4557_13525 [Bacteroidota bacterium]